MAASLKFYVCAPQSYMRLEPQSDAEVVSELIFSEEVSICETTRDWVKVKNCADNYVGWVHTESLCKRALCYPALHAQVATIDRLRAHIYRKNDTSQGPLLSLGYESRLEVVAEVCPRWIQVRLPNDIVAYVQRGDIVLQKKLLSLQELPEFSKKFLNIPYTWGGRSSFGYDCSGFVQMLYRQMALFLPRDAKDQYLWEGFEEVGLDTLKPGDLLFWARDNKIGHVGMHLHNNDFIHAGTSQNMPYIRINNLLDPKWQAECGYSSCMARRLYPINLKNWIFGFEKAPRLNDRK